MDTKPTWRLSTKTGLAAALAVLGALHAAATPAQVVYSEDFTGANTANSWYFYNGACLTAGTGTSTTNPGLVPGCATIWNSYYTSTTGTGARAGVIAGLPQLWDFALVGGQNGVAATCASPISNAQTQCSGTAYTLPDPVGKGALRFTNGFPYGFLESGAIVSAFTFGAGAGVHITFKTVTYRGDSGSPACSSYDACTAAAGNLGDGADGIGFYLIDASHHTPGDGTYNGIGSWGGSLGYSCSQRNPPFDGLVGGYIGLGIDEYGDYLSGANYVSGYTGPNPINAPGAGTVYGDNTATGYGQKANRIGIRGNGNLSFAWLNANYPTYYPSSLKSVPVALNGNNITAAQEAVYWTCIKGTLWNFSNPAAPVQLTTQPVADYAPIPGAYVELPSTVQIANESAVARTAATPISYDLKITQNGLLSLSYSVNGGAFQSVLTNQNITTTNGALPSLLRFGFAGTAGGHTNIHEILCFKAAPPDTSASSASANQTQASKVASNAQVYYSYYNPSDWTGTVTANALYDTAGVLTVSTLANWDAQCTLSGIAANTTCTNTGVAGATSAEAPTSRVMLSWNGLDTAAAAGTAGEPFEFGNLTTAQIGVLDAGDGSNTANRLNYLRGVRTNEINTSGVGLYRARDGVLGDIVDSSPVWVGPPSSPFALTWKDRFDSADVMPENSGQSYTAFAASQQSRLNVVYVGANDGFLHGFRTGSEDASGNLVANSTTPNDGLEVLAYMPGAVLNQIHNSTNAALDYSAAQYGHAFYVDATPGTGDLYYSGQWHTWLVGGLGAGGSAIYALDVTNPTTANFTESQAANLVQGEWSSATITCVNVASCGNNLGNTYGTPIIRRLHNGTWAAIFGNGYGSTSGDAGIYVMTVSQTSGAKTFYYLSTGTAGGNGIAYVTSADLDGDRITDYVYAGDLKGLALRSDQHQPQQLGGHQPRAAVQDAGRPAHHHPGRGGSRQGSRKFPLRAGVVRYRAAHAVHDHDAGDLRLRDADPLWCMGLELHHLECELAGLVCQHDGRPDAVDQRPGLAVHDGYRPASGADLLRQQRRCQCE